MKKSDISFAYCLCCYFNKGWNLY